MRRQSVQGSINKDSIQNNINITSTLKVPCYATLPSIKTDIGDIIYNASDGLFYGYSGTGWITVGSIHPVGPVTVGSIATWASSTSLVGNNLPTIDLATGRISNLGAPIAPNDAARLQDIATGGLVGVGGPSTLNTIPRWVTDTTLTRDSGVFIDNLNNVSGINDLTTTGTVDGVTIPTLAPLQANATGLGSLTATDTTSVANIGISGGVIGTGVWGHVRSLNQDLGTANTPTFTGANMTSTKITNLGAPIANTDAARLQDVLDSVTSVSVASANGFNGTVATPTTTPVITLLTTITGMIKGFANSLVAAVAGVDYAPGTSGLATGLLQSTTGTGALSIATSGTDYSSGTSALASGILYSTTGTGALSIATTGQFPTLNQNTTGTASNVTGTVLLGNGGTGLTATPTAGQLLIGTGAAYQLATLTAGAGIAITNGAGAITIAKPINVITAPFTVTNAETKIVSYSAAANELQVGTSFKFEVFGAQTVGGAGGGPTFWIRIGPTTLTGTVVLLTSGPVGTSATFFTYSGIITMQSTGASSVAIGSIYALKSGVAVLVNTSTSAASINTTVANIVEFNFSASNATNSYTFQVGNMTKIN